MDIVRIAIARPIAVIAAVIMVVMFGLAALLSIPIQLAPDVNNPVIVVSTNWPGAAPEEIEREIVNRQEDKLRGLEGLESMESRSRRGQGEISLEFRVGQDMDRALMLVANRLDRVESYPDEADEPVLGTSSNDDQPFARFMIRAAPGNERDIDSYGDWIEDNLVDPIERLDGVSSIRVLGGREREMVVDIEPTRLARYNLTVGEVVNALRGANISASAGDVDEGKRRYTVRTEGDFERLEQVAATVLRSERDPLTGRISRVTVGDIADVRFDLKERNARLRYLGEPAISMWVRPEQGANIVSTMDQIRAELPALTARAEANDLVLVLVSDDTQYIDQAIALVTQNIWVGGTLAAVVLLLFLRSGRATAIIAIAMPISVIGAFVAMAALGRSINVISLAGMAFAIGMVVDAAIVVLENIYRLRKSGLPAAEAAYRGAKQVWGAILVSALTTVMVFIPILVMELEVGQLFRDIAVAISVSVLLSLIVATTVIPALSARMLQRPLGDGKKAGSGPFGPVLRAADGFGGAVSGVILRQTDRVLAHRGLALGVVAVVTLACAALTYLLLPKLEYLPEGNRAWIGGFVQSPPGYNLDTVQEIVTEVEAAVRPYFSTETGFEDAPDGMPKIADFFVVALTTGSYIGFDTVDPERVGELAPVVSEAVFREPGTFGFFSRSSLFGRGVGGARAIDIDISGPDLEVLLQLALRGTGLISDVLPRSEGTQINPRPGLELGAPQVRVVPDRVRLADAGVSARELATAIDAFNDGIRVAEITVEGERMDLTLTGRVQEVSETQGIGALPVVTPSGEILPVSSLATVEVTAGPTQILRKERLRTVTLSVRPTEALALEEALEIIEADVIAPLAAEGLDGSGLPEGVTIGLSGTADKLTETWNAMLFDLLLAIVIVYLVMAVLLENFAYPLLIMIAVPLATAGGVVGLGILNLFVNQPLDMLTMLGFVILIGIVVNNAILLIHQSLHGIRDNGLAISDAIREATRTRIRPIFMSTLTSVFGMMPLVVFPGAGSELYRGLGSVVLGGLALSAILTLLIIPSLLSLTMATIEGRGARKQPAQAPAAGVPDAAE